MKLLSFYILEHVQTTLQECRYVLEMSKVIATVITDVYGTLSKITQNIQMRFTLTMLVILAKSYKESVEDLSEKWLYQLDSTLKHVQCENVALLVNEDNIHYKYLTFNKKDNQHTIRTRKLRK